MSWGIGTLDLAVARYRRTWPLERATLKEAHGSLHSAQGKFARAWQMLGELALGLELLNWDGRFRRSRKRALPAFERSMYSADDSGLADVAAEHQVELVCKACDARLAGIGLMLWQAERARGELTYFGDAINDDGSVLPVEKWERSDLLADVKEDLYRTLELVEHLRNEIADHAQHSRACPGRHPPRVSRPSRTGAPRRSKR